MVTNVCSWATCTLVPKLKAFGKTAQTQLKSWLSPKALVSNLCLFYPMICSVVNWDFYTSQEFQMYFG